MAASLPLLYALKRRLLLAWQDVHAALVLRKLAKALADGHCATAALRESLKHFRAHIRRRRESLACRRVCLAHATQRRQRRSLVAWRDVVAGEGERRRKAQAANRIVCARICARAAAAWSDYVARRRRKRERILEARQAFRAQVLQEGARRWLRAGTEALRWRQERALDDYNQRSSLIFTLVARIALHWLALTRSRKAQVC
jgi:hypothetical protein